MLGMKIENECVTNDDDFATAQGKHGKLCATFFTGNFPPITELGFARFSRHRGLRPSVGVYSNSRNSCKKRAFGNFHSAPSICPPSAPKRLPVLHISELKLSLSFSRQQRVAGAESLFIWKWIWSNDKTFEKIILCVSIAVKRVFAFSWDWNLANEMRKF